ncbi:MAG: alanine--tRNA ligase [Thermoplasmata archaeon]
MPSDYELRFFLENGFTRQQCPTCGRYYWSQGTHQNCGETPCQEYLFIASSPMKKKLKLSDMRETYQRFFEDRDHTRVRRYPVVARWRDDVFYTQASVYPFQPWVIEGLAEPPANPLVISQPCVRFNDIDNVGKTGQHFTLFEMMAHHVFNYRERPIYFKERTTELCHEFMTRELGIDPPGIRYVEAWWEGGGNSGPCFEVTAEGAELATLVFMVYRGEGDRREPMDCQVVDTGYGLERLTWVSQASPSAYEAVFGEVLDALKQTADIQADPVLLAEYSKVAGGMNVETHGDMRLLREKVAERVGITVEELMEKTGPLEDLYAVCDHARALAFVLNDGVVPSNVKEGYFARLLVRRALRALERLDMDLTLPDVLSQQIHHFSKDFPELVESEEEILKLVKVEERKYRETLRKGRRIVRDLESKMTTEGRGLGVEHLVDLYDSHGLVPEVVRDFAQEPVEIPDDFFSQVALRHLQPEEVEKPPLEPPQGLPPTKLLFYDDPRKFSFEAKVSGTFDGQVILDETYFYPEGGGQEADTGQIGDHKVVDVQLVGGVVLHRVEGAADFEPEQRVECRVDRERRLRLMRHHTATHIVNGAARAILGGHVWQAGARKSEDRATLDITHYENLSREELEAIEKLANRIVLEDRVVHQSFVKREEAEARHGFVLYQGGSIPGKMIRVVDIDRFDVEACGGTHTFRTGEVGLIKILRSRRIQDGVVRLEYVAGEAALEYLRDQEGVVRRASAVLKTKPEDLPQAAERLLAEWRGLSKRVERFEALEASKAVEEMLTSAEEIHGFKLVTHQRGGDMKDLLFLARLLLKRPKIICVLGARNDTASILIGRSRDVPLDASEAIGDAAAVLGGKGGGKPDFARGGGPRVEKLEKALDSAVSKVKAMLQN